MDEQNANEQDTAGKKYILHHQETVEMPDGAEKTLWRIQAVKDFDIASAGQFGGLIESESNLSQDGDCWVAEEAKVFDGGVVREGAVVHGSAEIRGNAEVYGNARVSGKARIFGKAKVYGWAKVLGDVLDNAVVCGISVVEAHNRVCGDATACGETVVHDTEAE